MAISKYFDFIAVTGIFVAIVMMLIHLLRISEKLVNVPWDFIEFAHSILWAVMFLIGAAILTSYARTYLDMSSFISGAVSNPYFTFSHFWIINIIWLIKWNSAKVLRLCCYGALFGRRHLQIRHMETKSIKIGQNRLVSRRWTKRQANASSYCSKFVAILFIIYCSTKRKTNSYFRCENNFSSIIYSRWFQIKIQFIWFDYLINYFFFAIELFLFF